MRRAFLCDFDGTVSPRDIGDAFLAHFSPDGAAGRVPELADWLAGRTGTRELTRAQCALARADREQALAFTRGFALDPHFVTFVGRALAAGDAVMVVSEGFDFYVGDALARAGLPALPWAANRLAFRAGGRLEPEFPFADPDCAACGNCKARHVRRYRELGFRTVMVGDGASDRHGALAADFVLARGTLARWCAAEGVAHEPFADFADVLAWAERPAVSAAPARRPRPDAAPGAPA